MTPVAAIEDVFREFGRAAYHAQLVEYDIVSIWILDSVTQGASHTKQDLLRFQENWGKKTFGQLLKPLQKSNLTFDQKPKRRLFELLKNQGMQENQEIVFLSDGGEDVRKLQLYLNPQAEHLLDWFHVTMRLTVLNRLPKACRRRWEKVKTSSRYALRCSRRSRASSGICGTAMCFRLFNICSLWRWIWRAQHSRTRRRPRASCSKRLRNSAHTSNAMAALFRTTASATVTVENQHWLRGIDNQPSGK